MSDEEPGDRIDWLLLPLAEPLVSERLHHGQPKNVGNDLPNHTRAAHTTCDRDLLDARTPNLLDGLPHALESEDQSFDGRPEQMLPFVLERDPDERSPGEGPPGRTLLTAEIRQETVGRISGQPRLIEIWFAANPRRDRI